MARGKRKMLPRNVRNKGQYEIEKAEEKSPMSALGSSSSQGKKPKLEESEDRKKEKESLQINATTEPEPSMKPKLKENGMPKKVSKYVPPFSTTKKAGFTEKESSDTSPITRSSSRKRNLLRVLQNVPRQELEIEEENVDTPLVTGAKTGSYLSSRQKKEKERSETIPAFKHPKHIQPVLTKRAFSSKLKARQGSKSNLTKNKCQNKEKIARNKVIEDDNVKGTKGGQMVKKCKESKLHVLVDDQPENNYNGNEGLSGMFHSSTESKSGSKNFSVIASSNKKSDLIFDKTKVPYIDDVVKGCLEHLIQSVEENMLTCAREDIMDDSNDKRGLDLFTSTMKEHLYNDTCAEISEDRKVLCELSTTKKDQASELLAFPHENSDDGCTKISGHQSNDERNNSTSENCKTTITKAGTDHVKFNADPNDVSGAGLKAIHSDDAQFDNKNHLETALYNSSTTHFIIHDIKYSDHSNLKYLGPDVKNLAKSHDLHCINNISDECYKTEQEMKDNCKTLHLDINVGVGDDDDNHVKKLEINANDNRKSDHSDIDVVGRVDDDDSHKKKLETNANDNRKSDHSDFDVVGRVDDDDSHVKKLETNANNNSKRDHSDIDIVGRVDDDDSHVKNPETNANNNSKRDHSDIDEAGRRDSENGDVNSKVNNHETKVLNGHSSSPFADNSHIKVMVTEICDCRRVACHENNDDNSQVNNLETKVLNGHSSSPVSDNSYVKDTVTEIHDGKRMACNENNDDNSKVNNLETKVHNGHSSGPVSDNSHIKVMVSEICDGRRMACDENNDGNSQVNNLETKLLNGHSSGPVADNSHIKDMGTKIHDGRKTEYTTHNRACHKRGCKLKYSETNVDKIILDIAENTKDTNISYRDTNNVVIDNADDNKYNCDKTSVNTIRKCENSGNNVYDFYVCTTHKKLTGSTSKDDKTSKEPQKSKIEKLSLFPEEMEVPISGSLLLQEALNNAGKSAEKKCDKYKKIHSTGENESSLRNNDCAMCGTALSKCGEVEFDYLIDCTDSQLVGSMQESVLDGLKCDDDFNLEDFMDCTDSQLVDIENQTSTKPQCASEYVQNQTLIEDGSALIQDLIKEMSSIKHYLMDTWKRYEMVKNRKHQLAYTTVIKK